MKKIVVNENTIIKETNVYIEIQSQANISLYSEFNGDGLRIFNNSASNSVIDVKQGYLIEGNQYYTLLPSQAITLQLRDNQWFISDNNQDVARQLDVFLEPTTNGNQVYYDLATDEWKTIEAGFNAVSRWDDIIIYPTALRSGVSAPDLIAFAGSTIQVYAFNGASTTELLDGAFELTHNYKEGTNLRPHIHWCPSTANAGNVKWQLSYEIKNNTEVFTGTLTTVSAIDSSDSTAWKNEAVEFGVINGTDLHIGAQCVFTLFRNPTDAQDTYPDDAVLLTVGFHYEIDGDGSRNVFTK